MRKETIIHLTGSEAVDMLNNRQNIPVADKFRLEQKQEPMDKVDLDLFFSKLNSIFKWYAPPNSKIEAIKVIRQAAYECNFHLGLAAAKNFVEVFNCFKNKPGF